ncbi:hypothetical protein FGIG_03042 [Fasciola gigantica]|uniref:Uncharacterized protein n=1 Tax=Fasciola gigantica TaxID=46835 RepID=A0A504YNV5_FASGI|nr:hypothetical protein FGIG_03042 [Fasciola gigantica]
MQPTQLGRMQIFMHSTCVSNYHLHNHRPFNEKQCIQVKPKFLSHGAIWTQNFLNQGNQPLCCSQERKQSTKETGSYDVRGLMKDSCMRK